MKSFEEFIKAGEDKAKHDELAAFIEAKKPANDEEYYQFIVQYAREKGYDVTIEQFAKKKALDRELDESELDKITGGGCFYIDRGDNCSSTYNYHENCFFNDLCDCVIKYYKRFDFCTWTAQMSHCVTADLCYSITCHYDKLQAYCAITDGFTIQN